MNEATNPDTYKVDHLFLLVGKNPLPNYVVVKSGLLLRKGGKPYLIYTQDTQKHAYQLRDRLGITNQELISLGKSQADAFVIQNKIKDIAKKLSGRLGLNYTGGTKSMAVNAYAAIKSINKSSVFSYLDPKDLKLLIDMPDREPIPLKVNLGMSFEDLFSLHLMELKKPPSNRPILPELAKLISQHTREWSHWCEQVLRVQAKKKRNNGEIDWQSKEKLGKLLLSTENLPDQIISDLNVNNFLTEAKELSIEKVLKSNLFKTSKDACKWLDGTWLEHHLLSELKPNFSSTSLSFKASSIDFEFDVAFLNNYQLFAFSCTSDGNKRICKSKLFEAYIRGKQLGGDEARVSLVCCSDNPEALEKEITGVIPDSKIKVFGRKHIPTISDEIAQWVKEQNSND